MDLLPQTQANIAIAGDVFTLLAFAAPLFTAMPAIYKADAVGRRSVLPNIAAVLSCMVGVLYGCARQDGLAIAVSAVGAILQAAYVSFFFYYSAAPARLLLLTQCVVPTLAYLLPLTLYLAGVADADTLSYIAGTCGCLNPAMIAYNLLKVREDMSMECMPHPTVPAVSLVSAPLWILYAYAGKEPKLYIAIPNYAGLASGLVQVGLHGYFWFFGQQNSQALRQPLLE